MGNSEKSSIPGSFLSFEPSREKINNVVSEQV